MEPVDLQATYNYYSNMMKFDFIMDGMDDSLLQTGSLFNSYSTNPSDIEPIQVNNEQQVEKSSKKNKKLRITIPNATIRRHSHLRHRRSKQYENIDEPDGNDTN